jgi:amidase
MNVMGDRPLGPGSQGIDLDRFRLSGMRIGVLKPPHGIHPGTLKLYEEACRVFRSEGAVLVELEEPPSLRRLDEAETTALLYEFKAALNAYLAGLDPRKVPVRSLTELIRFNVDHAAEEMPDFGQELFEQAEACGPLTDARYRSALATLKHGADRAGLRALLARSPVRVLLAPGNSPAEIRDPLWGDRGGEGTWPVIAQAAAIAGYPSLTVPAGLVRGIPVGVVLVAGRFQEGLLLQVGNAYERAARARIPPRPGAA